MNGESFWRRCGLPVALCFVIFPGLNALYNQPGLREFLNDHVMPYPIAVFMLAGSALALFFLSRALRSSWLTRHDLGIDLAAWTAPRRLLFLVLLPIISYWQLVWTVPQATWGQYCFSYVVCLSASLAELLVFIGVGYGLIERWLRQRGVNRLLAGAAGVAFASVAFGLYHYTHEERWHKSAYVVGLMGEMLFILLFFLSTRNLILAVALHNAFAAIGFTAEQYTQDPLDVSGYANVPSVVIMVTAFVLPFLYLNWLEWKGQAVEKSTPV